MLRDVPRIYLLMFVVLLSLGLLTIWFVTGFDRGSDVLQLNDIVLASTVSEVDQIARLNEGALLLNNTFEKSVWDKVKDDYPEGSKVQFDYLFDAEDERFENVETGKISSPTYVIGIDTPNPTVSDNYMRGRPIIAVRLKIHKKGDRAKDWTYTATVTVDAESRPRVTNN